MRQLIVAATVLVALVLVAVPTASAQMPGLGGPPFGGPPGFGFGMMGAPGGMGLPGSPGGMGMIGAPGGMGLPGAGAGFGRRMPWNAALGGGPGVLGNIMPGCPNSLANPASVPGGSAPGGYQGCAPANATASAACTGPFTAALAPTGQGSAAVSGNLSFTQASNGAFGVSGTLTGVTAGQTITLTIPVTAGTPEAATAVVPAGSTSVSFGGTMSGVPADGGTVTVTETSQTGTLAQGAISGPCSGGTLANAPQ
jgi:hypothetical protein